MNRIIFILTLSAFLFSQQAEITNITASQRTDGSRLVDVCYDLQGDENFNVFTISAEISFDNGATYQAITMTTGNIGGNVEEGAGKCFVWDFGSEAGELYTANAMFRLTADSVPEGCVDIDGNVYGTVLIGEQLWMAENLKTTHYNDGSEIPNIMNNYVWGNLSTGAYGDYDNNPANSETYGRLYNWYTVDDSRGVCPDGFHVPSDDEYTILIDYLGGSNVAGGKMKSTGTIEDGDGLWYSPNTGATNESGFTALPAGYRTISSGYYYEMGKQGHFWSSSEYSSTNAWYRFLYYGNSNVSRLSGYGKTPGFSVRCLGN